MYADTKGPCGKMFHRQWIAKTPAKAEASRTAKIAEVSNDSGAETLDDSGEQSMAGKKRQIRLRVKEETMPRWKEQQWSRAALRLSGNMARLFRVGEFVSFSFPKPEAESKKFFEHKKVRPKASSDIVRFSTKASGEIGRLPAVWAKCLIPLVHSNKISILGKCKMAPEALSLMSSIVLGLRVYINKSFFVKYKVTVSIEETTFRPLPLLMELLKMTPQKGAVYTRRFKCLHSSTSRGRATFEAFKT